MAFAADTEAADEAIVKAGYSNIGMGTGPIEILNNTHPDAQWFGDCGLGLFIHWGIGIVKGPDLSHPMIAHLPYGPLSVEKREMLLGTKALTLSGVGKPAKVTLTSGGVGWLLSPSTQTTTSVLPPQRMGASMRPAGLRRLTA